MKSARQIRNSWLGPADQSVEALRARIQLLLTPLLVLTNLIGGAIVFGLSYLLVPGGPNAEYLTALAIVAPMYVIAAVAIGVATVTGLALRALRWVREGQDPTLQDRQNALQLPWRMTILQAALWAGGVVIFTVVAAVNQPRAVLGAVFSVSIAGLVVCAIAFLFAEFALRPFAARALAGRTGEEELGAGVERRMVVFWGLGTAAPLIGLVIVAVVALTAHESSVKRLSFIVIGLTLVVLVFGLLVTVLNARAVVSPIASVRAALARVGKGELDVEVRVDDATELGLLQSGFNEMVKGLREREKIRDLFGRHVGQSVATAATEGGIELGGETREVSVLMIDLIGSTAYAENRPPNEVVQMLNRFFTVVVEEVDRRDGLVNKFMGDAVLAIFGAPVDLDDHASAALASARAIAERLAQEVPEIGAGIGVSTGQAVAGNVGDRSRFEYTVIGDAVNSASRLTELAKEVDGGVLAATASVERADAAEQKKWTPDGNPVLRGRDEPTPTSRLLGACGR